MVATPTDCREQIQDLIDFPSQMWLLGAGISKEAGVPLMKPLTDLVEARLGSSTDTLFKGIRDELPDNCHVEHILSHLGDLIALAKRTSSKQTSLGGEEFTLKALQDAHRKIQLAIRDIIQLGYRPKTSSSPGEVGTPGSPIVKLDDHLRFVTGLFKKSRAGLESRPPVLFFTTNYDTLLEDALSFQSIATVDGFSGGSVAFWNPATEYGKLHHRGSSSRSNAGLFKLHGSIDWIRNPNDYSVFRVRQNQASPRTSGEDLLIYPQATKYTATQRDPFATLFSEFRHALSGGGQRVLVICGYSFGDDHINDEIELAMREGNNSLTLLAFVGQEQKNVGAKNQGLPEPLAQWLGDKSKHWTSRLVVAGSHGVYHGSLSNQLPCDAGEPHKWWTFQGVTELLESGVGGAV